MFSLRDNFEVKFGSKDLIHNALKSLVGSKHSRPCKIINLYTLTSIYIYHRGLLCYMLS